MTRSAGAPATAGGITAISLSEALECATGYARAGRVPTGRTLEELELILLHVSLKIAKQREGRKA